MKRTVFVFFICCALSSTLHAQGRIFLLDVDSLKTATLSEHTFAFRHTHYTLNTASLYGIDRTISLYNIIPLGVSHKTDLVLFAVLPDARGETDWEDVDKLDENVRISYREIMRMKDQMLSITGPAPFFTRQFNRVKLAVRQDGKIRVARNCLLQFFAIRSYPDVLNRPFGTIDIGQELMPQQTFQRQFQDHYPDSTFPLFPGSLSLSFEPLRMKREFLSRVYDYKERKAYQFWTFYNWSTRDGYEVERGIDRFVYVPDEGIIGGSFDFYFYFNQQRLGLSQSVFRENILKEKVMLTEELN